MLHIVLTKLNLSYAECFNSVTHLCPYRVVLNAFYGEANIIGSRDGEGLTLGYDAMEQALLIATKYK